MAERVEHLLSKCEALSSNSRTTIKKKILFGKLSHTMISLLSFPHPTLLSDLILDFPLKSSTA
jgi:hypothetical protein